jgi:hypothetical protein
MQRYKWSHLNKQQVGAYTEYFVKMELTMFGFQVYSTEVDDRGVEFVARYSDCTFIQIQVKSVRSANYVFVQKTKFPIREDMYLAVGLLFENEAPELFLVPAIVWRAPDAFFVDREYEGLKSKPEWGLNMSRKNMPLLAPYRFETAVERLIVQAARPAQGLIRQVEED